LRVLVRKQQQHIIRNTVTSREGNKILKSNVPGHGFCSGGPIERVYDELMTSLKKKAKEGMQLILVK
jgi:hypothetical protein